MSEPNQTPDTATVAKAMQRAWNDFVGDTGCYPDCFERRDGKLYADFTVGNFALMVANALADDDRQGRPSQASLDAAEQARNDPEFLAFLHEKAAEIDRAEQTAGEVNDEHS